MESTICASCRIHESAHRLFTEKQLISFEKIVFGKTLLEEENLRKLESFVNAYDKKDIEKYMRELDAYGLADFEKHPFDWYRYENCELCKRSYFFMMISFNLLCGAINTFKSGKLTEKQAERIEKILLKLLDFIPWNSPWIESYCNFLLTEASRFIDVDDEQNLDLENKREWLKDCILIFPNVVAKAIAKVNGAGIYLQYLDDLMEYYKDERVHIIINSIIDLLKDRYNEMPIDTYECPELEKNPYFMYNLKLKKGEFREGLKKLDSRVQKMILQDFKYNNSTISTIEDIEKIEDGLDKRQYRLYNSLHKKNLYKKMCGDDNGSQRKDAFYFYRKWKESDTAYEKFLAMADFFHYFTSFTTLPDRYLLDRAYFLCEKALSELGVRSEAFDDFYYRFLNKEICRGYSRKIQKVAFPDDYKYHYYIVQEYYDALREYVDGVPVPSAKSLLVLINVFEVLFNTYIDYIKKYEKNLIRNWRKFEEIVDQVKRNIDHAKKTACMLNKFRWFEAKLGFVFFMCFPGRKIKGKRPDYSDIIYKCNRGVCGVELLSVCLERFYDKHLDKRSKEYVDVENMSCEEIENWLDQYQFCQFLEDQIGTWYLLENIKKAEASNFFELMPFFAEGTSKKLFGVDLDEIAEKIRKILESKNEDMKVKLEKEKINNDDICECEDIRTHKNEYIQNCQERSEIKESIKNDNMQNKIIQKTDLIDFVLEDEKKQRRKGILDRLKETVSESVRGLLERKKEKK